MTKKHMLIIVSIILVSVALIGAVTIVKNETIDVPTLQGTDTAIVYARLPFVGFSGDIRVTCTADFSGGTDEDTTQLRHSLTIGYRPAVISTVTPSPWRWMPVYFDTVKVDFSPSAYNTSDAFYWDNRKPHLGWLTDPAIIRPFWIPKRTESIAFIIVCTDDTVATSLDLTWISK